MKKICCIVLCCGALLARNSIAQEFAEGLARLHFAAARDSTNWFEGFAVTVDGNEAPYPCHRSSGERVPALVARTTDGTMHITWKTAPVPRRWSGESATFLWVAGIGCNLGNENFHLSINGKHRFTFSTPMDTHWAIAGEGNARLAFTAVEANHNRALFGYMSLTVPASWLVAGEPLHIKITGATAAHEVWFRTFEYTDALAFFRAKEKKAIYHELSFRHLGAATLKLVANASWRGRTVTTRAAHEEIGSSVFTTSGDIALASIHIPRDKQANLRGGVAIHVDGKQVGIVIVPGIEETRIKAFLEEELIFTRYIFPPGEFPKAQWQRPAMVDNELGEFDLKTTFYDKNMKAVEAAAQPGRYGAVVQGTTPGGYTIRRYVTLFCSPGDWLDEDYLNENVSFDKIDIQSNFFEYLGVDKHTAERYLPNHSEFFSDLMMGNLFKNPQAAILLAGLSEATSAERAGDPNFDPRFSDRQWWVTFKRREFGVEGKYPALVKPQKIKAANADKLKSSATNAAVYRAEDTAKIRKICAEWAEVGKEPLVTLVAHKGAVVFHEAFGNPDGSGRDGQLMTRETPAWMASITKLLTGIIMMQFVDQGLIGLDDPVKKYLPELDVEVETPLTMRHLLTHTNGFAWHGEWGSDWNHALENYLGHCLPYIKIGKAFEYNRLGYALAGKVMERLSGRAMPQLFEELLIEPLDLRHTRIENTYGGCHSTAEDMARIAQMLSQRGSYGGVRFFSEDTFEKMLPKKLDNLVPGLDKEWGIGTCRLSSDGLSAKTFGHEAASGAILRIDPLNELIIVSARNRTGDNYEVYEKHSARLIEACVAPVIAKNK